MSGFDKEKFSDTLYDLLQESNTPAELENILDAFKLVNETYEKLSKESADGKIKGVVYSVRELDTKEMKAITAFAEKKLNQDVVLENKIDPSLISGFKIVCDNQVIDASLKNRVDEMKADLLK